MNAQAAGDAPRVQHVGSATPTGKAADGKGKVLAESGFPDAVLDKLRAKGHMVERGEGGFGGYQGILIRWDEGVLEAGSESRNDGAAAGY
jgi:gamma-glutamyltranspeptidase/glutathione hydrolase